MISARSLARSASRLALVLLTLLALAGCAFSSLIQSGDRYAAQGNWEAALAEYEEALSLDPTSPVAAERLKEARRQAIADALERARDAQQRRDWAEALGWLDKARGHRPALPEADTIEEGVRTEVLEALDGTLKHAPERAWAQALEAQELFPDHPDLLPRLAKAREVQLQASDALLQQGRFEDALALVNHIGTAERSQRRAMDQRAQAIRVAWADALRKPAAAHAAKGELGAAFVLYARAADVAQQPDDRAQRDALRERLLLAGKTTVWVEVEGDELRTSSLSAAVQNVITTSPGLSLAPRASSANIRVALELEPAACAQSRVTDIASTRYLAGTRQVPNPEHEARQRDALDAERRLHAAEAEELSELEELQRRDDELDRFYRQSWDDLSRRSDRASEELEREERRLSDEERALETIRGRLDEARRNNQDTRSLLDEERRQLDAVQRARREVLDARDALAREMNAIREFRRRAHDLRQKVEASRQELIEARREVLNRRQALTSAHERLLGVPPLRDEDVYADFRYGVDVHTRTCTGAARLTVQAEGAPQVARPRAQAATTDRAHEAHVKYNVREDPLRFTESDEALVRTLDAQLRDQTLAALRAALERRGQDTLAAADRLLTSDRQRAITLYVTHLLTQSTARRGEIEGFLKAEFRVDDLSFMARR